MKFLLIFFLAVTLAAALEDTLDNVNRIVNGTPAALGQFPYQVLLDLANSTDGWYCGGSLISSTWVLTAAHCTSWATSVTVLLGTIYWGIADISLTLDGSNIINHEDFNHKPIRNDIALIKIPPVEFTNNIKAIKLPRNEQQFPEFIGENVVISGWGNIDNNATAPDSLQYAEMTVTTNKVCSVFGGNFTSSMICATPFNGGSACFGDSGGPMVLKDDQILIGVASFRINKFCEDGSPTVFTRVTSYLDWIAEKTGIKY